VEKSPQYKRSLGGEYFSHKKRNYYLRLMGELEKKIEWGEGQPLNLSIGQRKIDWGMKKVFLRGVRPGGEILHWKQVKGLTR